jgi:flagellar hook-basal body complex protein FliE
MGGERRAPGSFGDLLKDAVKEVNRLQAEADRAAEGLVTGKEPNLHRTLVALEKADISFKLMMKVRDKIIDAYREVMRMNV